MSGPVKVGEILLEAGLIDEMQLRAALGEQKRWGRPLGATLVKLGLVAEHDLVRALASQLDLPVARIEGKRIHPDVLALVPRAIAEANNVMPLFVKKRENASDQLFLGMEDPGNLDVLDDLAFRSGMEICPVMVGPGELDAAVDRYYRRPESAESDRDRDESPTESPARASALEASDASPVHCVPAVAVPPGSESLARHWTQIEVPPTRVEDASPIELLESSELPEPPEAPELPELALDGAPGEPVEFINGFADPDASGIVEQVVCEAEAESAAGNASPAVPDCAETEPTPMVEPVSNDDVRSAAQEVDTRTILRALAQILIEKGLFTREEFHSRVNALRQQGSFASREKEQRKA